MYSALVLLIILCIAVIVHLNYKHIESYIDDKIATEVTTTKDSTTTVPTGSSETQPQYTTMPQLNLIVTPIVSGINNVVDTINEIPASIYSGCVKMSKQIGGKVREYAETMKSYHKSADDCEGLRNVAVNKIHKLYLDNLIATKNPLYNTLANKAEDFYKVQFDDQETEIIKTLIILSKTNEKIIPPLQEKIKAIYADDDPLKPK